MRTMNIFFSHSTPQKIWWGRLNTTPLPTLHWTIFKQQKLAWNHTNHTNTIIYKHVTTVKVNTRCKEHWEERHLFSRVFSKVLAPSGQLPSTLPVATLLYCLFIFLENDSLPQRLCKMSIRGRNYLDMHLTRWIMIYVKILECSKKLIKLASYSVFKILFLCWCLKLTLKLLCH
jgi:hypothetical protein